MRPTRVLRCVPLILIMAAGLTSAQDFNEGVDAYLNGDYRKAFSIWNPLATGGDPVAMFNVGVLHSQGLGVPKNLEEGVNWYRQSAAKGYAPAQFNLGVAFREGTGIRKSATKASQWFRAAAEQDHRHAQYNLASLYWIGDGVEQDRQEAVKWFEKAAQAGDQRAQQILARINNPPLPVGEESESEGEQMIADRTPASGSDSTRQDSEEASSDTTNSPADELNVASGEIDSSVQNEIENLIGSGESESAMPKTSEELLADSASEAQPQVNKMTDEQKESGESTDATQDAAVSTDEIEFSDIGKDAKSRVEQGADWITNQPKEHFTIQVFADRGGKTGSFKFIEANNLKQANHFVSADGWNKVVVGSYPSRDSAKKAVTTLPEAVQKQQPWIRPIADVQKEVNDASTQELSIKASKVEQKLFAATDEALAKAANVAGDSKEEIDIPDSGEDTEKTTGNYKESKTMTTAAVETPVDVNSRTDNPEKNANNSEVNSSAEALAVSEMTIKQRLNIAHDAFIEQDFLNAHRMWEPLAYAGYAEAQYGLAYLFETGSGIPRSENDAFEWYRLAAEQGHSQAQFNLGLFYMEGRGVMNNEGLGLYWIQTAADNKEQRAKDYLDSHREKTAKE